MGFLLVGASGTREEAAAHSPCGRRPDRFALRVAQGRGALVMLRFPARLSAAPEAGQYPFECARHPAI